MKSYNMQMADDLPIQEKPIEIETETGEKPVIKVEPPQQEYKEKKSIIRSRQIVWYVLSVLEVVLLIRFILQLFGANPSNIFSILIFILTIPFRFLFIGLFPSTKSLTSNAFIEWSTLFAMLFYAVVAFLIALYYRLKKPINPQEAEKKSGQTIP